MTRSSSIATRVKPRSLHPGEFCEELENISHWWSTIAVDDKNGGFHGVIDHQGRPDILADKCLIQHARICWFFSRLAIASKADKDFALAQRAFRYLVAHFVDDVHGGVIWLVDVKGKPVDSKKLAYAQAFALYAFAAYFGATNDRSALELARSQFDILEKRFRDPVHDGYFELFNEDWSAPEIVRLSPRDQVAPKSMNSHLHIMEAYSELYRFDPQPKLHAALKNLLHLHAERIFCSDRRHLKLYWSEDWRDLSTSVSFGHDIEASWLLCEAADLVGDFELKEHIRTVALALAASCAAEAIGPNGEVFNERSLKNGRVDESRIWWAQAEAMVGFLNAYKFSGQSEYLERAEALWDFIVHHIIDRQIGEWRWYASNDHAAEHMYLSGPWKACYHNGRAMLECAERLEAIKREGIA